MVIMLSSDTPKYQSRDFAASRRESTPAARSPPLSLR